jgi:hypothetical protein
MDSVATELENAWNESSAESGFHADGVLSRVAAERAGENFYRLFFKKTGMHDALVRGLFNDWCKLPNGEAVALREEYGVANGFCAFMARYIENRTACAGRSTAAHVHEGTEEEVSSEVH